MADLIFDLHTHTVYSHGKGSIEDNAAAAESAGLELLGIADHGPGHIGFGIDMKKLPQMRADIQAACQKHGSLKILLGTEANIINPSGHLDLSSEDIKLFDYIIAGYHYGVLGEAPFQACIMIAGGYLSGLTGRSTQRQVNHNTDIVLKALETNPVKILTHPGDKIAVDMDKIAECCSRRGIWMEINDHHKCLTVEGIRTAAKYDVTFVLGSDAHVPANVAKADAALERAWAAGLDPCRIINLRR